MKVLILGASGLLGHNVTQQLLNNHHEVVAVVRNKNKLQIQESHLNVISGELTLDILNIAAKGCNAIINCAGTTDMTLLHQQDYMNMNRNLCNILIAIMQNNNISRLVHVSTANTIGFGTKNNPTNETAKIKYPFTNSWYALSKLEGEQILKYNALLHPTWHIIIVNPGFMIGKYDINPSSGKLLLAAYHKPIMITPKGGKSFIAAKDVATAIINGLTLGTSGNTYLLTNKSLTIKELYQLQSKLLHYHQYIIQLPNWLIRFIGLIGDVIRKINIKTQLSTRNIEQLLITEYYNNQKAIEELKMPQTSINEAILDFFKWQSSKNMKYKKQ